MPQCRVENSEATQGALVPIEQSKINASYEFRTDVHRVLHVMPGWGHPVDPAMRAQIAGKFLKSP
jgi:hypothetical protein